MTAQKTSRGLDIITELLDLTRKMANSGDADFLIEAIDRRGELMAEYDALKASGSGASTVTEAHKPEISEMINEIIELDKKINKSLFSMYHEAKTGLQSSTKSNKILNYTNQAISASGSYMDFKE